MLQTVSVICRLKKKKWEPYDILPAASQCCAEGTDRHRCRREEVGLVRLWVCGKATTIDTVSAMLSKTQQGRRYLVETPSIKKKRDDSGHNIGIYRGACEHLAALCGGIEIVLELV